MQDYYKEQSDKYMNYLLSYTVPFWENFSIDTQCGGYFTCLTREGKVFDTDKFIWLQCRQMWMFSYLYQNVENKEKWLEIAKIGYQFLKQFGFDQNGNWYFSLDRLGNPLIQPYNIFSDCFAALAFGRYSVISGDKEALEIAIKTYNNILTRKDNPKGQWTKQISENRPLKGFSLPMILCNLSIELSDVLPKDAVDATIDTCLNEIFTEFYDNDKGLIRENVFPGGLYCDSFEGRLTNPGHAIEAMWFIMDIAVKRNESSLLDKAIKVVLNTLKWGWDDKYGGIFYFLDIEGYPPQQLEWDQKLWWVHLEALVALSKAYALTQREDVLEWYQKVDDYCWNHFADYEYGDWYGYLNRQGEVLLSLKGGKWKGFFHVPRGLLFTAQSWKKLIEKSGS